MSNVTDDAMVVEQETGTKILLVEGSYQNIKITTRKIWRLRRLFCDIERIFEKNKKSC